MCADCEAKDRRIDALELCLRSIGAVADEGLATSRSEDGQQVSPPVLVDRGVGGDRRLH